MRHVVEQVDGIVQHHRHAVGTITQAERVVEYAQRLDQRSARNKRPDHLRRLLCACCGTGPLNAKPRCRAAGHGDHPPLIERARGFDVVLWKMAANQPHFAQQRRELTGHRLPLDARRFAQHSRMTVLGPGKSEVREESRADLRAFPHVQHFTMNAAHEIHAGHVAHLLAHLRAQALDVGVG